MPKTIVILLDGTSNEIERNRTNVLRLYGTLRKHEAQLVYYDPGVGTLGGDGWLRWWRWLVERWGLLTGWGLDENVKQAYRYLVENYDKGDGSAAGRDRIYLFGYSRGAYSARVLAGFIHNAGLIEKRNLNLLDYVYRAYKRIGESGKQEAFDEIRLYERTLRPDRPPIRALALFDTVASVIEHGRYGPRLRKHAGTRNNPSVESVRHAVAVGERRIMFRPQLWGEKREYWGGPFENSVRQQDVRELWFPGVHGDVGGGYPEAQSALAKVALKWMIDETQALGLDYVATAVDRLVMGTGPDERYVRPDPLAPAHRKGFWPFVRRRRIPEGALIHRSVMDRAKAQGKLPENLPERYEVVD